MTKTVHILLYDEKQECKKRSDQMKELETKVPTEKDMASILSRRQLTVEDRERDEAQVDVHKINTVRLQGDLRIKKDKLETELRLLQDDLAKAHSRVYAELDSRREALEKELTEVNNRLEELAAEESERIRLLQERDVRIRNIAAKHQRLNQELMKNANKNRVSDRQVLLLLEGKLYVTSANNAFCIMVHRNSEEGD